MKIPAPLLAALCAAAAAAGAAIDLTPTVAAARFGYFVANRLQFLHDGKKIAISLDSDAQVLAADGGATVRFKSLQQATVTFRQSPLTPAVAFDADGLERYRRAALQLLPSSAEALTADDAAADPESINGGHSYRFTYSFEIAKVPMRESIMFLNIDASEQLVVQTGAMAKHFEEAARRASSMVRGWHELTPAEERGEN